MCVCKFRIHVFIYVCISLCMYVFIYLLNSSLFLYLFICNFYLEFLIYSDLLAIPNMFLFPRRTSWNVQKFPRRVHWRREGSLVYTMYYTLLCGKYFERVNSGKMGTDTRCNDEKLLSRVASSPTLQQNFFEARQPAVSAARGEVQKRSPAKLAQAKASK